MSYKNGFTYENIMEIINRYKCKLLDSKEEIDSKPTNISLISKCGHNSITTFNKLCKYKFGIYCNNCVDKFTYSKNILVECCNSYCNKKFKPTRDSYLYCSCFCQHSRKQNINTINKISKTVKNTYKQKILNTNYNCRSFELHTEGNKFIKNILNYKINIELTNRKSRHNFIVKPITNENNSWLPIEIKYSDIKIDDNYYFTFKKYYSNIFILLVYMKEQQFWLIPPNILNSSITRLRINIKNKYTEYIVSEEQISDKIIYYYNSFTNYHITDKGGLMPENLDIHSQTELKYINIRTKNIEFLNFEKPDSYFLTYNFIINGKKIQETVSYHSKTRGNIYTIVGLKKSVNDIIIPFDYSDNDFYWLNEQDENTFYVISNDVLLENGYLSINTICGKKSLNVSTNQHWLYKYKFFYSTINEEINKNNLISIFYPK